MISDRITNKNKWKYVAILLFITLAPNVKAQTQLFSYTQFMNNLTPLNPAYSLLDKAGSVSSLVREQWVGVDGAPVTYLLNGNLPLESINSAAGSTVFYDSFGVEHQAEANVYFAKAIQLGEKNYLGVSMNAGIRNYVANYSQLGSADPLFVNDVRNTKPNVGFGIIYYSDWYYLGISVPELTITSLGTASIQNKANFRNNYYFSGALITNLNDEDFKLKPAVLFTYANGIPLIADLSATIIIKNMLGLGMDYRTNNELAGILTLSIGTFQIGYSYQSGTSPENLGAFNVSTHEVSLIYRFGSGASKPRIL